MSVTIRTDQHAIGRDEELAAVAAFLRGSAATALVIEGEAGIGKTTLWRHGIQVAESETFRVLAASPTESEMQLPFAAIGDLFDEVIETVLKDLPDPQRQALEGALLLRAPSEAPVDRRAVAVAVIGALRLLATDARLVLAIDDVQWLDAASRHALEFALRRLADVDICVLLTRRTLHEDERLPLLLDRAQELDVGRIAVGGLSLGATAAVLRDRLEVSFRRPTLRRIHEVSGGNPFFALELGGAFARSGDSTAELPLSSSLRELVLQRVATLPFPTIDALRVVAALSDPAQAAVDQALGGESNELLRPAREAQVLEVRAGRLHFTHPLLRAAVYGETTASERKALHTRLAKLDISLEERARHAALSTDVPDTEIAVMLDAAAEAVARRGAPEAAADLAEHARRLTPPESSADATVRGITAAAYHLRAGDTPRARALLEEVVESAPTTLLRARGLHQLARARMWEEGYGRGTEVLEAALAEDAGDPELEVVIRTDLSLTLLQSGRLRAGVDHGRRAIELATALGLDELTRSALVHTATAEFLLGEGLSTDLLERAAATDTRPEGAAWSTIVHSQLFAALLLKWADDFEEARLRLETLYRDVLERNDESPIPSIAFQLGQLECWLGNFERAQHFAEAGRTAVLDSGHAADEASAVYVEALVAAHIGRMDEARSAAAEALELAEHARDMLCVVRSLALLGFIELSLGRTDEAAPYFRRAAQVSTDAGYGEPNVLRFHSDAAEILVAVGALDEAEALLGWLEERGRRLGRVWTLATAARGRALHAAALGDLDRAVEAVEEALAYHERLQQPFELARTLLVHGSLQRRRRERRLARDTLKRALEIFDELGTPLWAEKAKAELARIGGRTASGDELTPSEQRIAALVAGGKTNKEVASELFVSVHTVEAALTRIYGKLSVRSRSELAGRIS